MKKIALCLILCMLVAVFAASCADGAGNANADKNTTGENEPATPDVNIEKPDENNTPAENTGDETEPSGNETEPSEKEDEEYIYYYNPKLAKCYRKNDNTVVFTLDTAAKDPDGNLHEHIYISDAPDGEPIAWAKSTVHYEGELSTLWSAIFDVTVPESFYLCFKASEGEDTKDPDLKTVLCDLVNIGLYGETKLADGGRVAAVQNGSEVIEATLWVEANLGYYDPAKKDVTYVFTDPSGWILNHNDGKTVLLVERVGPGSYAEYKFTGGSRVSIYNELTNASVTNDLRIFIDGELVGTVDDREPFDFIKDGLDPEVEHTVKIVCGENSTSADEEHGEDNKWMFYISGIRYTNDN